MRNGTIVKYNDAGNIIYGRWHGNKAICFDKDKTTVYKKEWLKVVKFQLIMRIYFKIFNNAGY